MITIQILDKKIRPMYDNVMNRLHGDASYNCMSMDEKLTKMIDIDGVYATIQYGQIYFVFNSTNELVWLKMKWG